MGNAAAKELRAAKVVNGTLDGNQGKCITKATVSTKAMSLKMLDTNTGSYGSGFRSGDCQVQDKASGKVLYTTTGFALERMFKIKVLDAEQNLICVACSKDVFLNTVTMRLLRPDKQSYRDQTDFKEWAREETGPPLYPFGTLKLTKSNALTSLPSAAYSIAKEDEEGDPIPVPLYEAKMVQMGWSNFLMSIENVVGDLVARISQPDKINSKALECETGKGVDVVAVVVIALFFGVQKSI